MEEGQTRRAKILQKPEIFCATQVRFEVVGEIDSYDASQKRRTKSGSRAPYGRSTDYIQLRNS